MFRTDFSLGYISTIPFPIYRHPLHAGPLFSSPTPFSIELIENTHLCSISFRVAMVLCCSAAAETDLAAAVAGRIVRESMVRRAG